MDVQEVLDKIRAADTVTRGHISSLLQVIGQEAQTVNERKAALLSYLGPLLEGKRVKNRPLLDVIMADVDSYPEMRGDDGDG